MANKDALKLSPEQIENWRRILTLQFGPMAQHLTAEQIQQHRDSIQAMVDCGGRDGGGSEHAMEGNDHE